MNRNGISPCYQCQKRQLKCHSVCHEWAVWREEQDRKKAEIQARREAASYFSGMPTDPQAVKNSNYWSKKRKK